MVVVHGRLEYGASGLGEDTLFLQDGEDAHGLEGKRTDGVRGGSQWGRSVVGLGSMGGPPQKPTWLARNRTLGSDLGMVLAWCSVVWSSNATALQS